MFFKRSTLIVLILLFALISLAVYLNNQKEDKEATAEATPTSSITYLFGQEQDDTATAITIKDRSGKTVSLHQDMDGTWLFDQPTPGEAIPGYVEMAVSQLAALRVLNTLDISPAAIGLKIPAYVLTIQFSGGSQHTLQIGDATPTGTGYYVTKDDGETVIVSKVGLDSLLELFINPPYQPTAVPTETATQAPTVIPETAAPAPTATP